MKGKAAKTNCKCIRAEYRLGDKSVHAEYMPDNQLCLSGFLPSLSLGQCLHSPSCSHHTSFLLAPPSPVGPCLWQCPALLGPSIGVRVDSQRMFPSYKYGEKPLQSRREWRLQMFSRIRIFHEKKHSGPTSTFPL